MGITTLYYFLGFIFFITCLAGVQHWFKMPQQKKDKIGFITLLIFLIGLLAFIAIVIFKPNYLSTETIIAFGIGFIFLLIVFTSFFLSWYNEKYKKQINISRIIIVFFLAIFFTAYFVLKNQSEDEKDLLIKNIELKTVATNITFDTHKPYFKDMTLADGQFLPMPETMNKTLQIGDSIYKNKGEKYYTVINFKTKLKTQYLVTTHIRVLAKPQ